MPLLSVSHGGAVATAQAVESANIVGYMNVPVEMGYSAFTPVFKDVASEDIDLQSIVPCAADGSALGTSKSKIYLYCLSDSGEYGTTYQYNSSKGGWCVGSTLVEPGTVGIKNGQGFAVYNNQGSAISFRVSGSVDFVCRNLIATGYSMTGNYTPVSIDIQDIKPYAADGSDLGTSKGKIYIYGIDSTGEYTSTYQYNSSKGGWCVGSSLVDEGTVIFAPGSAFAVYNNQGAVISFQLPSPISVKE